MGKREYGAMSRSVGTFLRDESGIYTIFGLYLFVTMAVLAALALDVSNLYSNQNRLQVAADSAAHAALYYREWHSADEAKDLAVRIGFAGAPKSKLGEVIRAEDIHFGYWDREKEIFRIDEDSHEAVTVETAQAAARSNPVYSYLFQLVGATQWDVKAPAVFEIFKPMCFREGFVAEDIVDLQSNNSYFDRFCIHSNTYVKLSSGNFFESGTVVSMPSLSDLELPQSGFETNEGLQAALRSGTYRLRILREMPYIIKDLIDGPNDGDLRDYVPPYITDETVIMLSGNKLDETKFIEGRIHRLVGTTNCNVTIGSAQPLKNFVFVTNCKISLAQNTMIEDVVLATTNTSAKSVDSPASPYVGRDDNCATGGGAQILTYGGMSFPSDLHMYGGQLLALGDIDFAANAYGIQGASMVAGGHISGTSNMNMGFCLNGMEGNFELDYFRLAY